MHNMCYIYVLNTTKRVLAHTHRGISMYVRLYTYIYSAGPRVSVWGGVTWCVFMAINSRSAIASPPTIIKNKVHLVEGYQSAAGTLLSVIPCYICIYLRTYMYTLEGWPCPLLTIVTGIGCKTLSTL